MERILRTVQAQGDDLSWEAKVQTLAAFCSQIGLAVDDQEALARQVYVEEGSQQPVVDLLVAQHTATGESPLIMWTRMAFTEWRSALSLRPYIREDREDTCILLEAFEQALTAKDEADNENEDEN